MTKPHWLGIGAQRSGTTWMTNLITEHPEVSTPGNKKELRYLHRQDFDRQEYLSLFKKGQGDWTPIYLRSPFAPQAARQLLSNAAPILVMLRDPVERFISAMAHYGAGGTFHTMDATWGGMYADHLDMWLKYFPKDQFVVMQYEKVIQDPQLYANEIWHKMGLTPVKLKGINKKSSTTSKEKPTFDKDVIDNLKIIYKRQGYRLMNWGIDLDLWSV